MTSVCGLAIGIALQMVASTPAPAREPRPDDGPAMAERQTSGATSGARRDPFVSLLTARKVVEPEVVRVKGLPGVAVDDVVVAGILTRGTDALAILAGPDGAMYIARPADRLHDAVIRTIGPDGVVFLATVRNPAGTPAPREIRRTVRPAVGERR